MAFLHTYLKLPISEKSTTSNNNANRVGKRWWRWWRRQNDRFVGADGGRGRGGGGRGSGGWGGGVKAADVRNMNEKPYPSCPIPSP